jgi:RNA polymerase sigma factor FliA
MSLNEFDIQKHWLSFSRNSSHSSKNQLMTHYIWLVKYVLQQMNLPSNSILDNEDFLSIGILGLNEAIDRFDLERGVKFESYAIPRIKGIIQDELRKLDWLSRTARKKASDLLQASDSLRSSVGREATQEEIMQKLNVSPDEYQSYLAAAAAAKASIAFSENTQAGASEDDKDLLEEIPDQNQENTLERIENEERVDFIATYLNSLVERKRLVMTLYYYENLTFKEIGDILNVSESRICQIHSQVVLDLRGKLKEFENA